MNFGVAAAASAGLFAVVAPEGAGFSVGQAGVAAAAVVLYAVLDASLRVHGHRSRRGEELPRAVARCRALPPELNLIVNICLGMLLAASYVGCQLDHRHLPHRSRHPLRQLPGFPSSVARGESASSTFSPPAAPSHRAPHWRSRLPTSCEPFRRSPRPSEASAVIEMAETHRVERGAPMGHPNISMESWRTARCKQVLRPRRRLRFLRAGEARTTSEHKELLESLDASNLLAVPLFDQGDVVGCLLALDRIGAGEFGEPEAQMLEALGNELVLTLDSYRLFEEVTEERAGSAASLTRPKRGSVSSMRRGSSARGTLRSFGSRASPPAM